MTITVATGDAIRLGVYSTIGRSCPPRLVIPRQLPSRKGLARSEPERVTNDGHYSNTCYDQTEIFWPRLIVGSVWERIYVWWGTGWIGESYKRGDVWGQPSCIVQRKHLIGAGEGQDEKQKGIIGSPLSPMNV